MHCPFESSRGTKREEHKKLLHKKAVYDVYRCGCARHALCPWKRSTHMHGRCLGFVFQMYYYGPPPPQPPRCAVTDPFSFQTLLTLFLTCLSHPSTRFVLALSTISLDFSAKSPVYFVRCWMQLAWVIYIRARAINMTLRCSNTCFAFACSEGWSLGRRSTGSKVNTTAVFKDKEFVDIVISTLILRTRREFTVEQYIFNSVKIVAFCSADLHRFIGRHLKSQTNKTYFVVESAPKITCSYMRQIATYSSAKKLLIM